MKHIIDQKIGPVRRSAWALAAATGALLAGCGGEGVKLGTLYPVKGKVTLPDGKPLAQTRVVFSGPVTGDAVTGSDGTFAFKEGAGLPAGDYKVRLEVVEAKGTLKRPIAPFPSQYGDEDGSGLTAAVKPEGPNDFHFELKKGEATGKGPRRTGRGPDKDND